VARGAPGRVRLDRGDGLGWGAELAPCACPSPRPEMGALPPIAELVPHTPPMLAVDELLECAPGRAVGRLVVREDRFTRDGRLDSVVLLESMSQVVAACLGYEATREGGAVRVGMVVACREMVVARPACRGRARC
jgi:predicted hotdog family 3-hydroxylacyl-ACP dehydratase